MRPPDGGRWASLDQLEQLMPVIAAGYPGLTIVHDADFRALLAGDITAAPPSWCSIAAKCRPCSPRRMA